jgi:hypothetical protein
MNTGGSTSTVTDCTGPGTIRTCGGTGCNPATGDCRLYNCIDPDKGVTANFTKTSVTHEDPSIDGLTDACKDDADAVLLEATCSDKGEPVYEEVQCAFGCSDGKCIGEVTCTDTDDGLDYFVKGVTETCVGDTCVLAENESCSDEDTVWESYCGKDKEVVWQKQLCSEGCVDGACNIPEDRPEAACEPITVTGPYIQPGIRVVHEGDLKFCDPFSLELVIVKPLTAECVNDYECESNICVEGECASIRGELEAQREILEEQAGLLRQIKCFLRDVFGVEEFDTCMVEE